MAGPRCKAVRPKTLIQDDSIMGTNNSSIVSKRSVERLYFPHENLFRPFVKRPQRRAPLINRGYWLRMKAIDYVVRQFLEEHSDKPKIVINLGCGYDPLPFQSLTRYPRACKGVKFVDIDYKALLLTKRESIKNTTELNGMLTNLICPEDDLLLLQSDQYLQIGCDLRDLPNLSLALRSAVDLEESLILCTAEVSITYMDVEAADALIEWVGKLPDAWFCLLEQIIPDGIEHPFAATMMAHFAKLQTPLNAVRKYPTTMHQKQRFGLAGWRNVNVKNLWELWATPDFLTSDQRTALDDIEPFDEWEEFAFFCCHYFLLVAKNETSPGLKPCEASVYEDASHLDADAPSPTSRDIAINRESNLIESVLTRYTEYPKVGGRRRFAASLPIRGSNRQRDLIGNFGGMGLNTRLGSYDVYVPYVSEKPFHDQASPASPSGRMCHTTTYLGDSGVLLVGGRTSPDNALVDCWLFHKWTNIWERVDDLPEPRYRHSAIAVGNGVLVACGKSNSRTICNKFLVWNRRYGWLTCVLKSLGEKLSQRFPVKFGAILTIDDKVSKMGQFRGILAGGISQDGLISEDMWLWTLNGLRLGEPSITLQLLSLSPQYSLARFGATVTPHLGRIFVLGGIVRSYMLSQEEEVISVIIDGSGASTTAQTETIYLEGSFPRPLIIGSSVVSSGSSLVILGGGAICFSFGAFWNNACFTLDFNKSATGPDYRIEKSKDENDTWTYFQTLEIGAQPKSCVPMLNGSPPIPMPVSESNTVPRRRITSSADFATVVSTAQPIVLEGLELGSCTEMWTTQYLKEKIGVDRKVIVHQASMDHMDFNTKNFSYVTKSFGGFIDAIDAGEMLYLRALSSEKPTELPTNLERDYPTIAADFQLPVELGAVIENAHSSPLRISGPVNMWLHYDVMANVLCQIRGSKRLILFPPSDAQQFDFAPGLSSSSANIFKMFDDMKLVSVYPHEVILGPGDVLFLPALWLHTAMPIDKTSIAVNVFFRNLTGGYAAGRDVYGNRDLQAYEKGRQDVAKIANSFSKFSSDIRGFYIQRLAEELRQMGSLGKGR